MKSGYSELAHLQCPTAIIVLPNAPLKGTISHQPGATPWGNREQNRLRPDRERIAKKEYSLAVCKEDASGIRQRKLAKKMS